MLAVSVSSGRNLDRSTPTVASDAATRSGGSDSIDPIELYAAGIDTSDYVSRVAPLIRRSVGEIGDLLEMPKGSIGPTRARCLAHLRRVLEDAGDL